MSYPVFNYMFRPELDEHFKQTACFASSHKFFGICKDSAQPKRTKAFQDL